MLKCWPASSARLPNRLSVEGHTDCQAPTSPPTAIPIGSFRADRANAARKLMQQSGVRPNQVADVRGFADQRLRKSEDPNQRLQPASFDRGEIPGIRRRSRTGRKSKDARRRFGRESRTRGQTIAARNSSGKEQTLAFAAPRGANPVSWRISSCLIKLDFEHGKTLVSGSNKGLASLFCPVYTGFFVR